MSAFYEVVCAGCRRAYSRGEWLGLSIVDTLTSREVRPYVLAWKQGRVIEVRACSACGRAMARATTCAA
jgi:hypothetical protein